MTFIEKVKEPTILVTIVLACIGGGFTVGYNSNGSYINEREKKIVDLQTDITKLEAENKNLLELHKNVSFGDFLADLNKISTDIIDYKTLQDTAASCETDLERSTAALNDERSSKKQIIEDGAKYKEAQANVANDLKDEIDALKTQLYTSFDKPIVKTIFVGEAEVFIEPDMAVGLAEINTGYQRAKISFGETREKEVAVGENISTEANGKQCFVRFMRYERDENYRYSGTFSVYCTKS